MKELMQKLQLLNESVDPSVITTEDHWDDEQMSNDQVLEMLDKVYDYMVEKGVPKATLSSLLQVQQQLESDFESLANSGNPYDHDSFDKDDADYIDQNAEGGQEQGTDNYDELDFEESKDWEWDADDIRDEDTRKPRKSHGHIAALRDYDDEGDDNEPEDFEEEVDHDDKWMNKDSKYAAKNTPDHDDEDEKPAKRDYHRYSYDDDSVDESIVDECPMAPMSAPAAPISQPSSSTMSINMNGTGKDGIRDILTILRDIEDGPEAAPAMPHSSDAMGDTAELDMLRTVPKDIVVGSEEIQSEAHPFANSPNEKYSSIKDIMKSGNDMHKAKDSYSDKPFRGDNPMAVKEALQSLYQFVKSK